jgi:hypothetical protein
MSSLGLLGRCPSPHQRLRCFVRRSAHVRPNAVSRLQYMPSKGNSSVPFARQPSPAHPRNPFTRSLARSTHYVRILHKSRSQPAPCPPSPSVALSFACAAPARFRLPAHHAAQHPELCKGRVSPFFLFLASRSICSLSLRSHGPIFIGTILNVALYGISIAQTCKPSLHPTLRLLRSLTLLPSHLFSDLQKVFAKPYLSRSARTYPPSPPPAETKFG